jgi:hypothetical protein
VGKLGLILAGLLLSGCGFALFVGAVVVFILVGLLLDVL